MDYSRDSISNAFLLLINIRKLEGFSHYDTALNDEDIKGICKSGRGNHVNYKYDTLGRTTEKTIDTGIAKVTTKYSFEKGENGNTTTKVSEIDNNGKKIAYTYDANGNIETITDGSKKITYTYDELNQLTKEQNEIEEKEISYTYDIGGNIVSKTETTFSGDSKTTTYKYEDSNWKDKLTSFNGKAITYDGIGNPLTYDGWKFQWEQGRKLSKLDGNGYNISYKYNPSGIRTEKVVNGVVTKYHLEDDEVTFEENGKDKIHYTYDLNDNLISMNLNGQEYYYIRNAQNDIIALNNSRGTTVATYTYDSWGKLLSIKDENGTDITNNKDHVGYKNPYRYRGYRYDTETGLYYLNSRYYNSEWGRFVNADGIIGKAEALLSYNMFAYCNNNYPNMVDYNGRFAICAGVIGGSFIVTVLFGAALILTGVYIYYKIVKPLLVNNNPTYNIGENNKEKSNEDNKPNKKQNKRKTRPGPRRKKGRPVKNPNEVRPTGNHKTTSESKLPIDNQDPSLTLDRINELGKIIARRFYDELGRALRDVDFTNHGNPKDHPIVPHVHIWDWVK
ncbi:RHS repeat domain-containing protein [Clostridium botulinum]|uniref:RHS repeat domain-containing protein n=1 Tax=Clostridium botulinum TaxID=1491 RepID=UPI0002075733|nr:RHS repeat-associated core domain-containing protein [Clostridium botulinum]AEB75049.1 putative wall-associated protein [Clostridium botulinum BKT015925]